MIACLCYCFGSVLTRGLMRSIAPVQLAGLTNLIGGTVLLGFSLRLEPGAGVVIGATLLQPRHPWHTRTDVGHLEPDFHEDLPRGPPVHFG